MRIYEKIISIILSLLFLISSIEPSYALAPSTSLDDKNFRTEFVALEASTKALNAIGEALYLGMSGVGAKALLSKMTGGDNRFEITDVSDSGVRFSFRAPNGDVSYFRCFLASGADAPPDATRLTLPDGRPYWRSEISKDAGCIHSGQNKRCVAIRKMAYNVKRKKCQPVRSAKVRAAIASIKRRARKIVLPIHLRRHSNSLRIALADLGGPMISTRGIIISSRNFKEQKTDDYALGFSSKARPVMDILGNMPRTLILADQVIDRLSGTELEEYLLHEVLCYQCADHEIAKDITWYIYRKYNYRKCSYKNGTLGLALRSIIDSEAAVIGAACENKKPVHVPLERVVASFRGKAPVAVFGSFDDTVRHLGLLQVSDYWDPRDEELPAYHSGATYFLQGAPEQEDLFSFINFIFGYFNRWEGVREFSRHYLEGIESSMRQMLSLGELSKAEAVDFTYFLCIIKRRIFGKPDANKTLAYINNNLRLIHITVGLRRYCLSLLSRDFNGGYRIEDTGAVCNDVVLSDISTVHVVMGGRLEGRGDIPYAYYVASSIKNAMPGADVSLTYMKDSDRAEFFRSYRKDPGNRVRIARKVDRNSIKSADVVVYVTIPWIYGSGDNMVEAGIKGKKATLYLPAFEWRRAATGTFIDRDGSIHMLLRTGFSPGAIGIPTDPGDATPIRNGKKVIAERLFGSLNSNTSAARYICSSRWTLAYASSNKKTFLKILSLLNKVSARGEDVTVFMSIDEDNNSELIEALKCGENVRYISSPDDLAGIRRSPSGNLFVVNTESMPIESELFRRMIECSDLPIFISGNMSLSEAIRRKKPFVYIQTNPSTVLTSRAMRYSMDDILGNRGHSLHESIREIEEYLMGDRMESPPVATFVDTSWQRRLQQWEEGVAVQTQLGKHIAQILTSAQPIPVDCDAHDTDFLNFTKLPCYEMMPYHFRNLLIRSGHPFDAIERMSRHYSTKNISTACIYLLGNRSAGKISAGIIPLLIGRPGADIEDPLLRKAAYAAGQIDGSVLDRDRYREFTVLRDALTILGSVSPTSRTYKFLCGLLEHRSKRVRIMAVDCLARIADIDCLLTLQDYQDREKDPDVRKAIAKAMAEMYEYIARPVASEKKIDFRCELERRWEPNQTKAMLRYLKRECGRINRSNPNGKIVRIRIRKGSALFGDWMLGSDIDRMDVEYIGDPSNLRKAFLEALKHLYVPVSKDNWKWSDIKWVPAKLAVLTGSGRPDIVFDQKPETGLWLTKKISYRQRLFEAWETFDDDMKSLVRRLHIEMARKFYSGHADPIVLLETDIKCLKRLEEMELISWTNNNDVFLKWCHRRRGRWEKLFNKVTIMPPDSVSMTESKFQEMDEAVVREVGYAESLANRIKICGSAAKRESAKIIIGIETSGWMGEAQKSDMQALTHAVDKFAKTLERRGVLNSVKIVLGNSDTLLTNIVAAKPNRNDKVVLIGSESTLTRKDYQSLDRTLFACIDPRAIGSLEYLSFIEMLNTALEIALDKGTLDDVKASHGDIGIITIGERIVRLVPLKKVDINEPAKVYRLQIAELAKQA